MPAILRNSLPKYYASQSIIGSYAIVGAIGGGLGVRVAGPHRAVWLGGARGLEQYAMPDGVCTDRPSGPPDCVSTIAMLSVLYCPDSLVGLVWLSRPVRHGNGLQ